VAGNTTPDSFAVIEAGITTKIAEAQRRAEQAGVPPVVRQLVEPGEDVRVRWQGRTAGGET
jgi:hypothetical protein